MQGNIIIPVMTGEIFSKVILLGLALSMDAFAVSVSYGLTCTNLNKKRVFFIAFLFGFMQALMPLIGFWLVEGIENLVGNNGGQEAGAIMGAVVCWIAFALLLFIGGKMLFDGIKDLRGGDEVEKKEKTFSLKEVFLFSIATSIDALGSGVALHSDISTGVTIWLHVSIILVITFALCLVGLFLGKQVEKLFKGKYEITEIIGGVILILLAVWIVVEHYL